MLQVRVLRASPTHVDTIFFFLGLYFAANILVALYPLFRPKDDLTDIPLTPTQRALLGLDPRATTNPTPESTYVTPPKYRLSGSRKASPLSIGSSPGSANRASVSPRIPFSPSPSPLLQRAVANGNKDNGNSGPRTGIGSPSPVGGLQSFGTPASLGRSSSLKESTYSNLASPTPSPTTKRGAGVAMSSKWLYERSERLSTGNGAFSL